MGADYTPCPPIDATKPLPLARPGRLRPQRWACSHPGGGPHPHPRASASTRRRSGRISSRGSGGASGPGVRPRRPTGTGVRSNRRFDCARHPALLGGTSCPLPRGQRSRIFARASGWRRGSARGSRPGTGRPPAHPSAGLSRSGHPERSRPRPGTCRWTGGSQVAGGPVRARGGPERTRTPPGGAVAGPALR
jgi:hypothetical protein